MDDLLCALCIAACYRPTEPLQKKNRYNGEWEGPVSTLYQLTEAAAEGHFVYEDHTAMALGVYAKTFVKGIALCHTHALHVIGCLDLSTL